MWKRPVTRNNIAADSQTVSTDDVDRLALAEVSTNTPRAVKKQRVGKDGGNLEEKHTRHHQYFTTLTDVTINTPRSIVHLMKLFLQAS